MTRILIDRHHAGLFHAMQLLFEDRLGMTVYTPVGHEWWDQDYWAFGRSSYGDDRLARQFLTGSEAMYDSHYPDRLIRGITLAEAHVIRPDYVMATVQDNQQGFARLARDFGAQYMLQVGNVNQDVDWRLDPLALVSTEVPIVGRGVRIHQEFDSAGLFGYRDPVVTDTARSFVNCFSSTPCHDLALQASQTVAVGFHGIDGSDGNIDPIADVADLMAGAGWGWHDKVQGDGFGHVIHMWAAIGRPLIGHGQHYRGLMAEPFWEDGVTCIDLDRHSVPEAVERVQTITPEEHRAMCRAIRAKFDAAVDWAAEAESVRGLLAAVAVAA